MNRFSDDRKSFIILCLFDSFCETKKQNSNPFMSNVFMSNVFMSTQKLSTDFSLKTISYKL